MFNENSNCINHKDSKFLFYCFDDKSYLCEECYREHKLHKVEIKTDIKKVSDFIELLKKSESKNISKMYEDIERGLKELKDKIEQILLEVGKISEKMKCNKEMKIPNDISNIKYEEFENLINCINIKSKVINISKNSLAFLNKIINQLNESVIPSNFKYINKEASVVNSSKIHGNYNTDILLGKSTVNSYTLFEQAKDHFLIIDLNKNYYLKSLRIQVTSNDCTLKNFTVYVKETTNENDNWIKINDFIRKKEDQDNQYQSFDIGHFCRQVKFILVDTWGTSNGNYILINKIDFEVGE